MTVADVHTTMRDNVMVADVTGEIDLSNAEPVGSMLMADTPAGTRGMVLDLSRVSYLDSAGIAVIIGIRETLLGREQRLVLVIPETSPVGATLHLAGLWERVQLSETVEEALTALDKAEVPGRGPSD